MSRRDQPGQYPAPEDYSHAAFLELLPAYAAALVIGQPLQPDPALAAHLEQCATCRAELAHLLVLVEPIYAGEITAPAEALRLQFGFLRQPQEADMIDAVSLMKPLERVRRVVVIFSESLLAAARRPTITQAARGESLFRYTPDPQPPGNLRLVIEVFTSDEAPQQVAVQVLVDIPERSPVDQGGVAVTLDVGGQRFTGQTEATGSVIFPAVPRAGIAEMRVEVAAPEP